MSSNFIQFKGVYDYFVLCEKYRIICERKHEDFTLKIDNQVIAHELETRSRANNKLVLPRIYKVKMSERPHFPWYKIVEYNS